MRLISLSEHKTRLIAKRFAQRLTGGDVLGLIGNLGAGKTVFVKGLAAGLGIKKNIASPTFVLMKIYPIPGPRQIKFLVHVDACRIKSSKDLLAVGAQEYFNRPDTVVAIEWADKIKKILPKKTKLIAISNKNGARVIKL